MTDTPRPRFCGHATMREFRYWNGPTAALVPLQPYAVSMFHRAINCTIPDHKRLYFKFAREARRNAQR
jgi:hypothetical protein